MKASYQIIHFFSILFIFISCSSSSDEDPSLTNTLDEINYTVSQNVITNPERGFMHTWPVESEGASVVAAKVENLRNSNVSIVLRVYYLDAFKNSDLSTTQLNLIKTDFERFREAGVKCIIRFAYNSNQNDTDAPLSIIIRHLDQLQPLFVSNEDIIAFVQAGFIGSWGEWHYSTNGLTSTANKKAVVNKLLEVLPSSIKIQLRTPIHKQDVFDYTTPIDQTVGYTTTDIARVGFHNDCFLASANDYGTYVDVELEKEFISKEAFFVPTGGETCPPSGIPTASCNTAETEMTLLKWTYLNVDYYGPVIDVWRNNSCFENFQKKLGYRIYLKTATLNKEATSNSNFNLDLVLSNVGYAPVYNTKNSFLVFKSKSDDTLYKKALNLDIRKVLPNVDFDFEESVSLSGIPSGDYELYLKIEDSNSNLSERPEFAIQLANSNSWDADLGLNDMLHTLTIN